MRTRTQKLIIDDILRRIERETLVKHGNSPESFHVRAGWRWDGQRRMVNVWAETTCKGTGRVLARMTWPSIGVLGKGYDTDHLKAVKTLNRARRRLQQSR